MRIAILGTRGIPARYGGFETFAEELSTRLAGRGHDVTVYCRSYNMERPAQSYRGVRLVHLPTIRRKYLDTVTHTLLSSLHMVLRRFDAVLLCNAANSLFVPILRLTGKPVAVNVDGIERQRKKWNAAGRLWYRAGEYFATVFPNRIIADAEVIRDYYRKTYNADCTVIAYGADTASVETSGELVKLGLEPGDYVLYVSRLEPENNAHLVIEAFGQIQTEKKLAIVGDAPYSRKYIAGLKSTRDTRVVFTGAVYGPAYKELQSGAFCYVQATEVGGTHPALLEAMGAGNCVIANGTPENREVLGEAGTFYEPGDVDDLRAKLQDVLDDPSGAGEFGELARRRIEQHYDWEKVTDAYEQLFAELASK